VKSSTQLNRKYKGKGKGKFVLCYFVTEHHVMEAYWGGEV